MAVKWPWIRRKDGKTGDLLHVRQADQALERARKQETAEMCLKILESSWDKLQNIAKAMQAETEDKSGEESTELNEEVLTVQKDLCLEMAQI